MPDQNSAADEHAILQEITAPLATLPDDPLPIATDADFPTVLRGYDRIAVDAYVKRTSQLVAELQATRSPEAAVRRALERVGEQISGILQRAHETAEQITVQSRVEAENRLEIAREEAAQISASAESRVKELDSDTDRIWSERHRIVDDARELARQLLELADAAAERFPAADDTPGEASREAAGEPQAAEEVAEPEPEAIAPEPEPPAPAAGEAAGSEELGPDSADRDPASTGPLAYVEPYDQATAESDAVPPDS